MIGFEYWVYPGAATDGFIAWQVGGRPSVRVGAAAVGPDIGTAVQLEQGRLLIYAIAKEVMLIIYTLSLPSSWISESTLTALMGVPPRGP